MTFSPFSNNCWPAKSSPMRHDNPDGPCECGGTHTLASEEDRRHFAKEEIRKQLLNVIHGCEEEIESKFREIKGWMELLDDPP